MPQRGEVWKVNLGYAAKVRPMLVLTDEPEDAERNLYTVVSRTASLRGSQWELAIDKPFFTKHGAFDFQQIQSIDFAHFEHRMGQLTPAEMARVDDFLRRRLTL
jgi:mRNA interferase MazF